MTQMLASFRKPFAQQVAAFRLRLADLRGTTGWKDVWQAEHDRAFMVAGAMKAELLADLGAAVDKAIAGGGTLEDFRKDFRAIVEKNGWHGWKGEGTKGGEAWRTRVIYRTNMATSYAAGRWAQIIQEGLPFIVYRHGNSAEPRLQHLAWDGLILEADHPFWATHAPPNGWGCSCRVVGARSEAGAKRLGGIPGKTLPEGWQALDPRTGAPVGISKGWAYAPGASVAQTVGALTQRAVNWDYSYAVAFMNSLPESSRDLFSEGFRRLPSLATELAQYADKASDRASFAAIAEQKTLGLVTTPQMLWIESTPGLNLKVGLYDYVLDKTAIRHVLARHGDQRVETTRGQRAVVSSDFSVLAQIVDSPDDIVAGDDIPRRGPILKFEKVINGERFVALFEVRTGRRRLSLVTMWIEKNAGVSPTATP